MLYRIYIIEFFFLSFCVNCVTSLNVKVNDAQKKSLSEMLSSLILDVFWSKETIKKHQFFYSPGQLKLLQWRVLV